MNKFVTAIIVAAGNSTRMNLNKSKQLIEILSKPAIFYTLNSFSQSDLINEIIVVSRKNDMKYFSELIKKYSFFKVSKLVEGGKSRQESVINGVNASSNNATHFAIHDGARICITVNSIDEVIRSAFKFKACALGVPVKDTIKVIEKNGVIKKTLDRDSLWAIQTPQVFEKKLYLKALDQAQKDGMDYTDDCQLVENIGAKVNIIKGDYSNIKLTTADDIIICESILKNREDVTR